MFKQHSLSFHVVCKTFITQNYLFVIPNNILRFPCLIALVLHILKQEIIEANTTLKNYFCGNYSDDVYQCLNRDQMLLEIINTKYIPKQGVYFT